MYAVNDAQPLTVLLVDDEEVSRELAASAVSAAGYDVVTAKDGEEA